MWNTYGEGRYVGDEAAEWISNYLDKPGCKIYQLTQPRIIQEDKEWGDVAQPGDEVLWLILYVLDKNASEACYKKRTQYCSTTIKIYYISVQFQTNRTFKKPNPLACAYLHGLILSVL